MLVDRAIIKIRSGQGGRGSNMKYANQYVGGDGGHGGNVYIKGSSNMYDLFPFTLKDNYSADNGGDGLKSNQKGENGKDLTILVPLTTEVHIANELAYVIDQNDQTVKLLSGGVGGLGNVTLRRKKHLEQEPPPELRDNESARLTLILKLKCDIIFIGYPNAGKSSILNELSNARVKTAPYAFTTLEPQLGIMDGLRLMDLPGLIEGASQGKGLGAGFVQHTEYSKLLAHFVSLENEDPMQTYLTLRAEIKKISQDLYDKQELVVLTKSDEVSAERLKEVEKQFRTKKIDFVSCSIIDDASIEKVKARFKELVPLNS